VSVTLCSDVAGYQHFGGPCCFHLQGEVKMEATISSETLESYHATTRRHKWIFMAVKISNLSSTFEVWIPFIVTEKSYSVMIIFNVLNSTNVGSTSKLSTICGKGF
jgi:flagellar motor switch protein FliM